MIERMILFFASKRDLIREVQRLKAELERQKLIAETAVMKAELGVEALGAQREWLKALAAVARFEYAQNTVAADGLKAGGK